MSHKKRFHKRKRRKLVLWRFLQRNDVVLRIYTSFAFVLALTGVLTGMIFSILYQQNYIRSYTKLLTKQGKIIAKRVSNFEYKKKEVLFERYSAYVDELERAENTDVWIMAKHSSSSPLSEEYINADANEQDFSDEVVSVLKSGYAGEIAANSSYNETYGMTTLGVAAPITNKASGEVSGVVLMISMIDKQTMGLNEGKYLITLSVVVSIIISYFVAALFSRYLSRPLAKISKNISKMADGDYTGIEVKKPYSQIGILERSLDYLSGELRKSEKERQELEQVRRDFFANVSHELRTPITVMRGYTETLADGMLSKQEQVEELYHRMLQECQGMERLVEDLFILSKMQNPDFQIEKEPISLVQIFSDVIRSGKMVGREKGIAIELSMPEDDPCLMLGDYGRLRQMFMIIVDNAVKFSKENGKIEIQIKKESEHLYVSIRDFGVGISKEKLPFIFEKFYTSKMRQNDKGTGLGLMIARQIALRHSGDIRVESEENVGTCFSFVFEECTSVDDYQ